MPLGRTVNDLPHQGEVVLLVETPSSSYLQRTEWNVRDSGGTAVCTLAPEVTGGSLKTIQFARKHGKPVVHSSRSGANYVDPEVLAMRLRILERMRCFEMGAEIARGAIRTHLGEIDLWLLGSRQVRAAEGIGSALEILLGPGERFTSKAACWFEFTDLRRQGRRPAAPTPARHRLDLRHPWNPLDRVPFMLV